MGRAGCLHRLRDAVMSGSQQQQQWLNAIYYFKRNAPRGIHYIEKRGEWQH
jgi:hypothetical protein